jgi:hypothetical protein
MTELARRAVACKGWRWMPGMRLTSGEVVTSVEYGATGQLLGLHLHGRWVAGRKASGYLPDLDDPATVGCLLALVREAWGDPTLHVWYSRQLGLWIVSVNGQEIGVQEDTEAEVLVAALEAAP